MIMKKIYLVSISAILLAPYLVFAAPILNLNGQTGTTQSFVNDNNLTITSNLNKHTLGWTGLLAPFRGGTGVDLSALNENSILFKEGGVVKGNPSALLTPSLFGGGLRDLKLAGAFITELGFSFLNIGDGRDHGIGPLGIVPVNSSGDNLVLTAGDANKNGAGGNIRISAGSGGFDYGEGSGTGLGGKIHIIAGDGHNTNGGDIVLQIGAGDSNGHIVIQNPSETSGIVFDTSLLSDFKTLTFPDIAGTFSILEANQEFKGENLFSNPVNNFISGTNTSVHIGADGIPGCIIMGDSDGSGVTYITANDGVLSTSTNPSQNCQ